MKKNYFSYLKLLFLVIALVVGIKVVNDINQNLNIKRKAAEEKSAIPVSQWVPIKLSDLNKDIDIQTSVINNKIDKSKKPSNKTGAVVVDPTLSNSLKIQTTLKDSFTSMDSNKDGEVDYKEFNAGVVNLSDKIYKLKHTKDTSKPKGIYSESWQKISDKNDSEPRGSNKKLFRIVVEARIYKDLSSSLRTYIKDVEKDNPDYKAVIYQCNDCTKEEIKDLLKKRGTIGAVFVGDIPTAWYQTNGCFGWSNFIEDFPIDLYYMDLNGIWGGQTDCGTEKCFTTHMGDMQPEIFVARLAPPSEDQEVQLLKEYFTKNHNYRVSNGNGVQAKSLSYVDNEWISFAQEWTAQMVLAYPIYDFIVDPDTTNARDFKARWQVGYEHLFLAAHSNTFQHYFDPWIQGEDVSWKEVRDLKPRINFYNLYACSAALYTVENYIMGWDVFQESNYGLLAVGSTKTGSMLYFSAFYNSLSQQNNFGTAFKEWFSNLYAYGDKCWHGGMVMIGDPTLRITHVNATPMPMPTPP